MRVRLACYRDASDSLRKPLPVRQLVGPRHYVHVYGPIFQSYFNFIYFKPSEGHYKTEYKNRDEKANRPKGRDAKLKGLTPYLLGLAAWPPNCGDSEGEEYVEQP